MTLRRAPLVALLVAAAPAAPATAAADAPAYSVRYGDTPRATPTFRVDYSGSGTWRTTFHATPPNPGGKPDTNDARDASTQTWRLAFRHPLTVPDCAAAQPLCSAALKVVGTTGSARVVGTIDHRHIDGLYRDLDRTVRCTLRSRPPGVPQPRPAVHLTYDPVTDRFAISATDPVGRALGSMPAVCPRQGDAIDRILDTYFTPGFSFAEGWGPERWFTPHAVSIPASTLRRADRIVIRLHDSRANTPPRGCTRLNPAYERCRTGGSWSGRLTLTAVPSAG